VASLPKITERISESIAIGVVTNGDRIELQAILFEIPAPSEHGAHVKNVTFYRCLFTHQMIIGATFQGCTFMECQFNGARIKDCEFHQCKIIESCFYKSSISGTYLDPSSFVFSYRWYTKWANVNAWWYQALYRNAKDTHQERFARLADERFQFYRRYEYILGKKKQPRLFFLSLVYDFLLGYGYGVLNVLVFTCIFIAIFAFFMQQNTSPAATSIIDHIYFAVVSFTTVGYGDVTPKHERAALAITTGFLFLSFVWGAIVTAVLVKRLVK